MMQTFASRSARLVTVRIARVGWSAWLVVCGIGCAGCNQSAVVPPTTSIAPVVRPAPVMPLPQVPVGQDLVSPPSVHPIDPITANNPWKPETELREWTYLVLHHTASDSGSVESIHEEHLKRKDKNGNPWMGIGYHFVIGNGHGMGDGEIEATFRWKQQLQGAHAGVANYNQRGIGIVLIGNFDKSPPTESQITSVKRLVGVMKREFSIDVGQIIGHSDVKATECPGKFFPMSQIREGIAIRDKRAMTELVSLPGESRK